MADKTLSVFVSTEKITLYMEQWRDSRRDDGEEGRCLGLNGFVRFSLFQICETSFSATARVTWQSSTYRWRCFGSN
ncbi:unnamed protein product [Brassica rapa subsp. narinosa]